MVIHKKINSWFDAGLLQVGLAMAKFDYAVMSTTAVSANLLQKDRYKYIFWFSISFFTITCVCG